ncbi:hypothetical protein AMJ87_13475 [candidate division WOR_3 bacterium SM23_60]|uniref:Uncharacterized protein n=1 Tax=candidate division WOR_3 bacterium SM23_60 TaxID=1703780 RepID=A0A0S8G545_UNCW3|nr:MAG: hypothetical protein AMJ87_13475 [candidate division WOR_3 bacterium SM23_60]
MLELLDPLTLARRVMLFTVRAESRVSIEHAEMNFVERRSRELCHTVIASDRRERGNLSNCCCQDCFVTTFLAMTSTDFSMRPAEQDLLACPERSEGKSTTRLLLE